MYPGQFGPYILDDLAHFPKLEQGIYDKKSLYHWIFSTGQYGSGRVISYLSFLIDDNAWPNLPQDFKHTNILIHLLTGVLVFSFVRRILLLVFPKFSNSKNDYLALVITFAWLITPIHQSAIFISIQRMTLLMGLFVFTGLNFYLSGRTKIHNKPFTGYLLISIGIGILGLLGVFSKEPAILICLYALVLEETILKHVPWKDSYRRYWKIVFILIPLLLVILFYLLNIVSLDNLYAKRDYTLFQRLITEPRVIASYLGAIIFPLNSNVGPYFDDFVHSESIFIPISTFICCIVLIVSLSLTIKKRNSYPLLSFSILFFLAGHVLESTILPLELYFEHRNYVASLGVFFAVLAISNRMISHSVFIKRLTLLTLVLLLVFHSYSSSMTARIWGNREKQTLIWRHYHPQSLRAQQELIKLWLDYGMVDKVQKESEMMITANPNSTGLHMFLKLIDICKPIYSKSLYGKRNLLPILENGAYDQNVVDSIFFLRKNRANARCEISLETLKSYIYALLGNENYLGVKDTMMTLYQELSQISIENRNYQEAILNLDKAYTYVPDYSIAIRQAYLAMTAGDVSNAKIFLEKARGSPHLNKYDFLWREEEIVKWEKALSNLTEYR